MEQDSEKSCWFCQEESADNSYQVNLTKDDHAERLEVPACTRCQSIHKKSIKTFLLIYFVIAIAGAVATVLYLVFSDIELSGSGTLIGVSITFAWSIPALLLAYLWTKRISKGVKPQRELLQYPQVQEKIGAGYKITPTRAND